MQVRERRAGRQITGDLLRIAIAPQAGLVERVDADDRRAAPMRLLQRRQHARMIRARILPEDEDGIRAVEVLETDGALAAAEHLAHRHAARFVTQVRRIRQVVGAEFTREQLIQERGLVAAATRSVEDRLVR